MWLSADEALRLLRVKPQTLYANVSRGRIRAKADPTDARRSLYRGEDIDRLAGRPMEIDARNGVIVRLGKRHGIATPCNQMAIALLETMTAENGA